MVPELPTTPDGGISCQQARRQIERLIEECDLKDVERTLLMSHVRVCAACKAELESYRRLEVRLKETFGPLDTAPHFNERLMAALPQPGNSDSPHWARNLSPAPAAAARESARVIVNPKRSIWRQYWTFWAVSALVAIGLVGAWFQHGFGRGKAAESEPIIADVSGTAIHRRADGRETKLLRNEILRLNDSILSQDAPVELALSSGPAPIGKVVLAPNSMLSATNRHKYQLVSGAAYFHVRKDRPQSPNEVFEVDAGKLATVRVTGTAFCVDLSAAKGSALVVVEEGRVEVERGGQIKVVEAGQELDAVAGAPARGSDVKSRLLWMNPQSTPAKVAVNPIPAPVATPAPAAAPLPRAPFDWDLPVSGHLMDHSLAEGVEILADALGRPPEMMELLAQARGPLISTDRKISFSIYATMPLSSALGWMARDVGGLAFERSADGAAAHFRLSANHGVFGSAVSGALPDEIRRALDVELEDNLSDIGELPRVIDRLSARSGVEMIADRSQWDRFAAAARNGPLALPGNVHQKLDLLLTTLHLGCAWYDNALFISSPSQIEALTTIERTARPSPALLGKPVQQAWLSDLRELLMQQIYPPEYRPVPALSGLSRIYSDGTLSGHTAFANLSIDTTPADGPLMKFKSGLLGDALMASVLAGLQADAQPPASLSGLLSQPALPGVVPDVESLMALARRHLPVVECQVKCPPFSGHAFVNKTLTLGESLEWGAWLSGCGLRQDNNALIIDKAALCYGAPELQVLPLSSLAERRPALGADFPRVVARLLPELYPTFFAHTDIRCLGGRIVFNGDIRQLQLAARVRAALERAVEASGTTVFNLQTWRPVWRVNVERNLADSFKAGGDGKLSGSFAGLLRQSALSYQLRYTVLVDPATMKQHASDQIEIDAANLSIGQVLDALAAKIGIKAVIEGDVIWMRP